MSEFVKGQRVRVLPSSEAGSYAGREFVVDFQNGGAVVVEDASGLPLTFNADELEVVAEDHEQLRRGQRVRIVNPRGGETTDQGEVRSVSLGEVYVLIDGETFGYRAYVAEELEILHDGRAESTGIYEPQEDTFRVDQRVTINANPQAPASVRKLDGMSGKVCTLVPHIEVVLDGTFGRHVVDSSDLIPEVVVPSKRDEYAAKAEENLAAGHDESAPEWAQVRATAALVYATLAVAYGREQGR